MTDVTPGDPFFCAMCQQERPLEEYHTTMRACAGRTGPGEHRAVVAFACKPCNPPPPYEEFGRRLRAARKRVGLTMGQVARVCQVNVPMVSAWSNGHRLPKRAYVPFLAAAFQVSPESLARAWERAMASAD